MNHVTFRGAFVALLPLLATPAFATSNDPLAQDSLPLGFTLTGQDGRITADGECCTTHSRHVAGVTGDHVHAAGGWMLSMHTMRMEMDGMRDGTDSVSQADLFAAGYMVAPKSMTMDMLMLMGMYGVTDDTSLMAMGSYRRSEMTMRTAMGAEFRTRSEGMGDTTLGAVHRLWQAGEDQLLLNLGLSLPTGSTNARDATPMGPDQRIGYMMQLGTGTFDVLPGLTWVRNTHDWTLGGKLAGRVHLGRNEHDYAVGDRYELGAWAARDLGGFSTSLRLNLADFSAYDGQAADLNPAMAPPADPDKLGGTRLDAFLGVQTSLGEAGSLALEIGLPVHQDLDGPALELDTIVSLSWRGSF